MSSFIFGQTKLLLSRGNILSWPRCPAHTESWDSLISQVLSSLVGMYNLPPLAYSNLSSNQNSSIRASLAMIPYCHKVNSSLSTQCLIRSNSGNSRHQWSGYTNQADVPTQNHTQPIVPTILLALVTTFSKFWRMYWPHCRSSPGTWSPINTFSKLADNGPPPTFPSH